MYVFLGAMRREGLHGLHVHTRFTAAPGCKLRGKIASPEYNCFPYGATYASEQHTVPVHVICVGGGRKTYNPWDHLKRSNPALVLFDPEWRPR